MFQEIGIIAREKRAGRKRSKSPSQHPSLYAIRNYVDFRLNYIALSAPPEQQGCGTLVSILSLNFSHLYLPHYTFRLERFHLVFFWDGQNLKCFFFINAMSSSLLCTYYLQRKLFGSFPFHVLVSKISMEMRKVHSAMKFYTCCLSRNFISMR